MIINGDNEKVIGDVDGAISATIAATREAFEVLSQRLYKYSERAIIREWFCNAIDAHADADTLHIPVDITLPSEFDLFYTQRDYGIGLDPDGVRKYIAGYFDGNKKHTNDRIGGFGLGAKSPFGYTSVWALVTYKNGMEYTYTAFVDETGPRFLLTGEKETTEPNGVKIQIPVKPDDIKTWRREAEFVLRRFKHVAPNINAEFEYSEEIEDFSLEGDIRDRQGAYAIMAGVQYPIPPEFIEDTWLDNYGRVYIKFENGELSPMPSREELSLSPRTKENLTKRITEVCDKLISEVCAKIDTGKTLRERSRIIEAECRGNQVHKLPDRYNAERDFIYAVNSRSERLMQLGGKIATVSRGLVRATAVKYAYSGMYRAAYTTDKLLDLRHEKLRILVEDMSRGANLFLAWFAKENPELACNILRVKKDGLYAESTIEYMSKWFDESEIEVYTLSDYKDKFKRKAERRDRVYGSTAGQPNVTFVIGEKRESRFLTAKEVRELDLPYIVQYNGEIMMKDRNISEHMFRNIAEHYKFAESGYVVVYGSARRYIEESSGEPLAEVVEEKIAKEVNKIRYKTLDYTNRRGDCELIRRCGHSISHHLPEIYADLVGKNIDTAATERLEYWYWAMTVETQGKWNAKVDSKNLEIEKKVAEFEKNRPMLYILLRSYANAAGTKGKAEILKYYKVKV